MLDEAFLENGECDIQSTVRFFTHLFSEGWSNYHFFSDFPRNKQVSDFFLDARFFSYRVYTHRHQRKNFTFIFIIFPSIINQNTIDFWSKRLKEIEWLAIIPAGLSGLGDQNFLTVLMVRYALLKNTLYWSPILTDSRIPFVLSYERSPLITQNPSPIVQYELQKIFFYFVWLCGPTGDSVFLLFVLAWPGYFF